MRKTDFMMAEWLSSKDRFNGFGTVTFKQARSVDKGFLIYNSRENVEATCAAIRDRVFKHFKRKFTWVTAIEDGHGDKRIHAHMAIAVPAEIEFDEFQSVYLKMCGRMDWVYEVFDMRQIADQDGDSGSRKVIFYMTKEGADALALNATTWIG